MTTKNKETLAELITDFTRPEPVTIDSILSRSKSILGPLAATGYVVEIDEETYGWFLNELPPHHAGCGFFLCAEGEEPFRLFFAKSDRYFVRRLDWNQTRRVCRAARIPLPETD